MVSRVFLTPPVPSALVKFPSSPQENEAVCQTIRFGTLFELITDGYQNRSGAEPRLKKLKWFSETFIVELYGITENCSGTCRLPSQLNLFPRRVRDG